MTDFPALLYTWTNETPSHSYIVFSRIIGGVDFFLAPKGGNYFRDGDYSRDAIIANIVQ